MITGHYQFNKYWGTIKKDPYILCQSDFNISGVNTGVRQSIKPVNYGEINMLTKPAISKILYCTDLGKHTVPVFMHALTQAENNKATLTILHVVEPMTETAQAVIKTYLSAEDVKKVQKDGMEKVFAYMKKRVNKFLKDECGKSLESEPIAEICVYSGTPSEEILRVVEEQNIDMIVLGKSSNKVRGHRVMGSTTRQVNRLSKVPVLIVPNR